MLLEKKADIKITTIDGHTPLMFASESGYN